MNDSLERNYAVTRAAALWPLLDAYGFGADPTQWKHYAIAGADGGELLLDLSAGDHTLTLTGFGGGMNLDYLVLAPR